MKEDILNWYLNSDDQGISSKAMASALAGNEVKESCWSHPSDPSDFNRCLKLIKAVPAARDNMNLISAISDTWASLVENWEGLEKCFLDEVGLDWSKGREIRAEKTYKMMKDLGC